MATLDGISLYLVPSTLLAKINRFPQPQALQARTQDKLFPLSQPPSLHLSDRGDNNTYLIGCGEASMR